MEWYYILTIWVAIGLVILHLMPATREMFAYLRLNLLGAPVILLIALIWPLPAIFLIPAMIARYFMLTRHQKDTK